MAQVKFKCPACRRKSLTMTIKEDEGVKFWFCYQCKYNKRTELKKKPE